MKRLTEHSAEYHKTPADCKRGLRAIGWSQRRAAVAIGKSPAMVSMVLARQAKSQIVLDRLHALIVRELARSGGKGGRRRSKASPTGE
jgi:hypothetical protein